MNKMNLASVLLAFALVTTACGKTKDKPARSAQLVQLSFEISSDDGQNEFYEIKDILYLASGESASQLTFYTGGPTKHLEVTGWNHDRSSLRLEIKSFNGPGKYVADLFFRSRTTGSSYFNVTGCEVEIDADGNGKFPGCWINNKSNEPRTIVNGKLKMFFAR